MMTSEAIHTATRRPACLKLAGHLTREALRDAIEALGDIPNGTNLIVDASAMTSYDNLARQYFVEWSLRHRGHIRRLAVVTDNAIWKMVIRAMSLASRREMKPFDANADAQAWMRESR